jgi:class 3 adenylate cyclase
LVGNCFYYIAWIPFFLIHNKRFNTQKNRLPEPLRIRAGVNTGVVAWEPGTPIGFLQSTVIDEAARLQKDAEPDTLALPDPENPGSTLVWRL